MILVTGMGLLGSWICYSYPHDTVGFSHRELDISDEWQVLDVLKQQNYDAIINAAGVTNKRNVSPFQREDANIHGPNVLARCADVVGSRLIHVSSDCVFDGERGNYTEEDRSTANDNYGFTKFQGEVIRSPHLTVRTSFIGYPDIKGRGLLHWFHHNTETAINGYRKVLWNGFCVSTLAHLLVGLAYGRQTGLMHLFGETISKYELLLMVQYVYGHTWDKPYVLPVDEPVINRTLSTVRNDRPKPVESLMHQLYEMRDHEEGFKRW